MQMNWKLALPIAVVAIALIAALMGMSGRKSAVPTGNPPEVALVEVPNTETMAVPEPSGNVDDLVLSLVGEADQDLAFSADADEDMALVTSDSASLNGYATAYDETTF